MTVDAAIHAARAVRARLRDWLSEIGADSDDISDVVHAISEFVENAVEHGYATEVSDGVVVEASLAGDGNLHVSVIDRGQWKDYREGEQGRGRGLAMAEALVSQVQITHDAGGTTASVTHRLSRPANFVTDTMVSPVNLPAGNQFRIRLPGRRRGPHRRQRRRRRQHRVHSWTARSQSKAVPASHL